MSAAVHVNLQTISPFAAIHEWLNRVKDAIQHAGDEDGDGWKQESHGPTTNPTAAETVEKKEGNVNRRTSQYNV